MGPLISCFLFVDYFASNYFYVFLSCIPSPRLLWWSWVKVKCRSKLCEGQPLCHSALWCCLVDNNLACGTYHQVWKKLQNVEGYGIFQLMTSCLSGVYPCRALWYSGKLDGRFGSLTSCSRCIYWKNGNITAPAVISLGDVYTIATDIWDGIQAA